MTREEQLRYCKSCELKKMDLKRGLVCGLTDQPAAFDPYCPDFKALDKAERPRIVSVNQMRDNSQRARAATALLAIKTVVILFGMYALWNEINVVEAVQQDTATDPLIKTSNVLILVSSAANALMNLVVAIVFLSWFRRAYANLNRAGVVTARIESQAVWGFALPFINLIRPYQIADEIESDLHRMVTELHPEAKKRAKSHKKQLRMLSFRLFTFLASYSIFVIGFTTLDDIILGNQIYLLAHALGIVALIFAILMVRHIYRYESMLRGTA